MFAAQIVLDDGRRIDVPEPPRATSTGFCDPAEPSTPPAGPMVTAPLGRVAGARCGDKGGDANVGIWARTDAAWDWMRTALTVDWLRVALPEAAALRGGPL